MCALRERLMWCIQGAHLGTMRHEGAEQFCSSRDNASRSLFTQMKVRLCVITIHGLLLHCATQVVWLKPYTPQPHLVWWDSGAAVGMAGA